MSTFRTLAAARTRRPLLATAAPSQRLLSLTTGTAALILAAALLLPGTGRAAPPPPDVMLSSEVERLANASEIAVLNATRLSVDVYVNYESQPTVSDPKPLIGDFANGDELTPTVFQVNGTPARPYGMYTFEVRPKGSPGAPLLAAASVMLEQTRSFSAVFHEAPDGTHSFSIYENDLSPSANARLTVRNTTKQAVTWQIRPNGEVPDVPPDERAGLLAPGEWQTAADVTDNDYVIEFFAGGERIGMFPDLDLAIEKSFIVYLIGDPQPTADEQLLQRPVAFEELEVDAGDPVADTITAAAPPLSTTDQNAPVQFDCPAVTVWETNARTTEITAVDPDGFITNLSIDIVEPPAGGIQVLSQSLRPSEAIGDPARARVRFKDDIPDGIYKVWIAANRGSSGHQARCAIDLTVRQITIQRLLNQVRQFRESGDIADDVGENLRLMLIVAREYQEDGQTGAVCSQLKNVLNQIGAEKGKKISDRAADALAAEVKALMSDLACG
jgi:hypothetical protein